MGPLDAIKTGFTKSFQFKGRASRSEFWWFAALTIGGAFTSFWLVETIVSHNALGLENPALMAMILFLALTLMPFMAVGMRRFNDLGFNRYLFLAPITILLVGILISLYDSVVANHGVEYAGLFGAIIGYGGFLLTAPFVLLLCTLSSNGDSRSSKRPNPNEVPS